MGKTIPILYWIREEHEENADYIIGFPVRLVWVGIMAAITLVIGLFFPNMANGETFREFWNFAKGK